MSEWLKSGLFIFVVAVLILAAVFVAIGGIDGGGTIRFVDGKTVVCSYVQTNESFTSCRDETGKYTLYQNSAILSIEKELR